MKKLLTVLLVISLIGISAGVVFAHGPHRRMGSGEYRARYNEDDGYRNANQRIDLSQDQLDEIADLRDEFYNQTEDLRSELRTLNRELRDLEFRQASYDKIEEVEAEMEELLTDLDEKRAAHQKDVEAVLTEEQLSIIEENGYQAGERYNQGFNNDYNYGHHNGFNSRSKFSDRRDSYRGFNSFGPHRGFGMMGMMGMMGRGFNRGHHGFQGDRYRSGSGFGPGWCH